MTFSIAFSTGTRIFSPSRRTGKLDLPFGQALGAYNQAHRNADEIGVLELDSRALVAVVVEHLDALLVELTVETVGRLHDLLVPRAQAHHQDFERCQRQRPDDAVLVVILLDGRRHGAADAEPIAPHGHGMRGSLVVQIGAMHGCRVLRAQLEDVTDLDAAVQLEGAIAPRAAVASGDQQQIGPLAQIDIAIPVDTGEVGVGFIGPDHEIGGFPDRVVSHDSNCFGRPTGPAKPTGAPVTLLERARPQPSSGVEHRGSSPASPR